MYSHLKASGNPVTAVHVRAQEDLSIVDRLLEPQTIAHFLSFALGQNLPDGTRPASIGTVAEDEVIFLRDNHPPGSDGESIIDRVMKRIGSMEDGGRLCLVGKNIQSLKSRLWEGIVPLSDQRWQEKGLHLDKNFDIACQHLSAVVAVFEYLNQTQVRGHLRQTFNLIYQHWEDMDTVLAQKRVDKGEDPISVAKLWTIFISSHYKVIVQTAHSWVTKHVEALRVPLMHGLLNHRSLLEGTGQPDERQWELTDHFHMLLEIAVRADYTIMIPMSGYKGYTAPANGAGPSELYLTDLVRRGQAYAQRVKAISHQIMYQRILGPTHMGRRHRETSGESYHDSAMDQIQALEEVRRELRGDPVISSPREAREAWISESLALVKRAEKKNAPTGRGMAIYRLTQGQSESEWTAFVQKFEAHVLDWGRGQAGSDAIKPHLQLHWIDGKEIGLAEGDVEAAKQHFIQMVDNHKGDENHSNVTKSDGTPSFTLQSHAFLVVDSASFASYTTELYKATTTDLLAGDFTGFVLAVDPHFDPAEGISRPDESPGYAGQMRILGSLIWGDLYALLESQSARLDDLWPLAMHHPNQVYVGPIVPLEVFEWRVQNVTYWKILRGVLQYAKGALG